MAVFLEDERMKRLFRISWVRDDVKRELCGGGGSRSGRGSGSELTIHGRLGRKSVLSILDHLDLRRGIFLLPVLDGIVLVNVGGTIRRLRR
jgi:hypothetical protein